MHCFSHLQDNPGHVVVGDNSYPHLISHGALLSAIFLYNFHTWITMTATSCSAHITLSSMVMWFLATGVNTYLEPHFSFQKSLHSSSLQCYINAHSHNGFNTEHRQKLVIYRFSGQEKSISTCVMNRLCLPFRQNRAMNSARLVLCDYLSPQVGFPCLQHMVDILESEQL